MKTKYNKCNFFRKKKKSKGLTGCHFQPDPIFCSLSFLASCIIAFRGVLRYILTTEKDGEEREMVTGLVDVEKVGGRSTVTKCFSKYPLKFIVPRKVSFAIHVYHSSGKNLIFEHLNFDNGNLKQPFYLLADFIRRVAPKSMLFGFTPSPMVVALFLYVSLSLSLSHLLL